MHFYLHKKRTNGKNLIKQGVLCVSDSPIYTKIGGGIYTKIRPYLHIFGPVTTQK